MTLDTDTFILFELDGTTYALPTSQVQHVEMLEHVTPVPSAPAFVEGVVLSRGQVVPVINLRARFGMARQPHNARTRLIIVRLQDRLIGLIVDRAREFRGIPSSAIRPVDPAVAQASGAWLSGTATVDDRLVLLPSVPLICELPDHGALTAHAPSPAPEPKPPTLVRA